MSHKKEIKKKAYLISNLQLRITASRNCTLQAKINECTFVTYMKNVICIPSLNRVNKLKNIHNTQRQCVPRIINYFISTIQREIYRDRQNARERERERQPNTYYVTPDNCLMG